MSGMNLAELRDAVEDRNLWKKLDLTMTIARALLAYGTRLSRGECAGLSIEIFRVKIPPGIKFGSGEWEDETIRVRTGHPPCMSRLKNEVTDTSNPVLTYCYLNGMRMLFFIFFFLIFSRVYGVL